MEKKKKVKKKDQKEKDEIKEQEEIRKMSYDKKILEERIKKLNQELNEAEPKNIIQVPPIVALPSILKKIEAPQKTPVKLERSIMSSNPSITKEIEEDSIEYDLNMGEKKKEEKYNIMSQEYSTMQKEARKQNPNFLVQSNFEEFSRRNISEDLPRRNINVFAEESLRNSEKKEEEYFVKPSFIEKERKPHNPFEKKEIKYEKFEQ
jgi:hypothetical protein